MTVTKEDLAEWEALIQSVQPLNQNKSDKKAPDLIKKLRIKPRPERIIQNIVDLHGLTLQEAYTCVLKFVTLHFYMNTNRISIITGKGLNDDGKIKKEIELWLDTPVFKEKIRTYTWINSGGTIRLDLKKKKEKKNEQ